MSITHAFFATSPAQDTTVSQATRLVTTVGHWIRRRYAIHMHRRVLHDLPDYILADIGISRSMIDGIVPERLDAAGRPKGPYPF
jgi:uncharacterized protein YjiS (DUF1127 family)